MPTVQPLMRQNFLEYASYVVVDRAIPDLRDGFKPVQRRIMHTLHAMDDGKFNKVANVIGETMKLHPHGDASIGDALVVLANKEYFIERQGNFGNPFTGDNAAAPRYIECRLTDLAKETLFNKELTQWVNSYDGRRQEPVVLPAKIPVILMIGVEGIAVGMATKVLPHNFGELLAAQIAILRGEPFQILPDFIQGGIMDVADYADGRGKVRIRAKIEAKNEKSVVITQIPFGTTTESVIASIEVAAQKGKVKIAGIQDYTTDAVEIELALPRGIYADEVIPQLYAYTECEQSITSNITVIDGGHPSETTVSDLLRALTEDLKKRIRLELEHELANLEDKRHWLTLERIFIENRVYKRIEEARTEEAVSQAVWTGMKPFESQFVRPMSDEDVKRLLEIRIRRISLYDIERHQRDMAELDKAIKSCRSRLRNLVETCITWLKHLLDKYSDRWPRKTVIQSFEQVSKKAVARQDLKVAWNSETGFFGTDAKGDKFPLQVSEYDRILIITQDGVFRIVSPPDKLLLDKKPLRVQLFDGEQGITLTVVFRDKEKECFAKKVFIKGYIQGKEYELIKDREGRLDMIFDGDWKGKLHLDMVPAPRQKVHEIDVDLAPIEISGTTTRGTRLSDKAVAKISVLSEG